MILQREERRERERDINVRNDQWPPVRALTGDRTHSLGMCPEEELSMLPVGVGDDASTNWVRAN